MLEHGGAMVVSIILWMFAGIAALMHILLLLGNYAVCIYQISIRSSVERHRIVKVEHTNANNAISIRLFTGQERFFRALATNDVGSANSINLGTRCFCNCEVTSL